MILNVTPREHAAILAGLRCLQQVRGQCDGDLTDDLQDILDNGGTVEALDDEEIDALCERINA